MIEVYVSPEEFLRQMVDADAWMPEIAEDGAPAMLIRKEGCRIRVLVENFKHMDISSRISWQQRLDMLRTAPEIDGKRRY